MESKYLQAVHKWVDLKILHFGYYNLFIRRWTFKETADHSTNDYAFVIL